MSRCASSDTITINRGEGLHVALILRDELDAVMGLSGITATIRETKPPTILPFMTSQVLQMLIDGVMTWVVEVSFPQAQQQLLLSGRLNWFRIELSFAPPDVTPKIWIEVK